MRQGTGSTPTLAAYLCKSFSTGSRIGLDTNVHTISEVNKLANQLQEKGCQLVTEDSSNIVDLVWGPKRPPPVVSPVRIHPVKYAGQAVSDKLMSIRNTMAEARASAYLVTVLDELCWVLNIRGNDSPFNQLVEGYLLITEDTTHLFIGREKLTDEVTEYLSENNVVIERYEDILPFLQQLSHNKNAEAPMIWMDDTKTSFALYRAVSKPLLKPSCISLLKACKNDAELIGMRTAHVRDGVAMVHALFQLEQAVAHGVQLSEVDVDKLVTECRSRVDLFIEPSFATIAGFGSNGAIVHYR